MELPDSKYIPKPVRWAALIALAAFVFGPGLVFIGSEGDSADAAQEMDPSIDVVYADAGAATAPVDVALREPGPAPRAPSVPESLPELVQPVAAAPLETAEAALPDTFDCIIEPSERVVVGTAETGVLSNFHAERSEFVSAGQVLAELESDVEQAAVELAAARARMSASVRSRQASLELGSRRRERASELFAGDVLSLDKREEAETEARLAELELEHAREERRLASIALARAEAELGRRTIRSPISGIVVERHKAPGEVVKEEGILTVAQIDPLQVEVILPSGMFGEIRDGMRAEITPEAPADGNYIAAVDLIDRVIDPASSTFGVRLDLPNPDHSIPSGLHCRVRFINGQ